MYFFRQTFNFYDGGYGSTLAWAMFIVIMTLTALVFWSARYWVHYQYERGSEAALMALLTPDARCTGEPRRGPAHRVGFGDLDRRDAPLPRRRPR